MPHSFSFNLACEQNVANFPTDRGESPTPWEAKPNCSSRLQMTIFTRQYVRVDEMWGNLLAQGWMLGILLKLIKVARGALFFQALFECELKQAFIMWPQPWSPWCCERGLDNWQPGPAGGFRWLPLSYVSFFSLLCLWALSPHCYYCNF